MRTQPTAVAVALALAAFASTAGAAPASCVAAGSQTLRASGPARLYSAGSKLYGCVGSRRTRLGSLRGTVPFPARRVVLYALSARYAATDTVDMGVDTLSSTVNLVDLVSGKTIATAPATTPERAAESFSTVTEMKVNDNGVLAWIGQRSAIGALKPVYELHIAGAVRVSGVIASATIPLLSLKLNDTRLSYQFADGGQRETIPLKSLA
jgi:hypothetical protein